MTRARGGSVPRQLQVQAPVSPTSFEAGGLATAADSAHCKRVVVASGIDETVVHLACEIKSLTGLMPGNWPPWGAEPAPSCPDATSRLLAEYVACQWRDLYVPQLSGNDPVTIPGMLALIVDKCDLGQGILIIAQVRCLTGIQLRLLLHHLPCLGVSLPCSLTR